LFLVASRISRSSGAALAFLDSAMQLVSSKKLKIELCSLDDVTIGPKTRGARGMSYKVGSNGVSLVSSFSGQGGRDSGRCLLKV